MGFQVSPGVNVTERDLTTIVPAVATTNAGMAGGFQWGPCDERVLIDSENNLRQVFGDPNDATYNWFFTAANFLGYGNNLQVIRSVGSGAKNASTDGSDGIIKNRKQFDAATGAHALRSAEFIAKYPGAPGNSLRVVIFDDNGRTGGGSAHAMCLGLSAGLALGDTSISGGFSSGNAKAIDFFKGDKIVFSNGDVHTITESLSGVSQSGNPYTATNELKFTPGLYSARAIGTTFEIENRYASAFNTSPSTSEDVDGAGGTNDEMNIAVIDHDGHWTGNAGEVLEVFEGVSKATDAVSVQGGSNFYKDVINDRSKYLWASSTVAGVVTGDKSTTFPEITRKMGGFSGGAPGNFTSPVGNAVSHMGFSAGVSADDYAAGTLTNAQLITSFLEFEDAESVDVSLILGGVADATCQKLIVDMCDKRKDCIAFLSPVESTANPAGLVQNKTAGEASTTVRDWRNNTLNKSSSYAFLDSGFKVMLDRYNDVLRYVPLNGDIAGLCARTETEQEAWYSPAGFTRGQIRGVVKLAFEPRKAHRDELYKNSVNPVVSFPGEGTVLFGDKTLMSKPSAFDRINVRRLFIVLEKAIATAARFLLFEFNDEFTRAQFRNMVIPFLRTVESRRGIHGFKVVCDDSNNTGEVIDRNEFVGDIYIKPSRSINYIQLNFIATKTGVDFSEVGA